MMQILSRAPKLEYFRMGSSRVGSEGGIALARSMMTGEPVLTLILQQAVCIDNCLGC